MFGCMSALCIHLRLSLSLSVVVCVCVCTDSELLEKS